MQIRDLIMANAMLGSSGGGGGGGGGSAVFIVTDTDGVLNKTYNEIVTAAESKVVMYKYTDDDGHGDVCTIYCHFFMSESYGVGFSVCFRDEFVGDQIVFTASSADGYPARNT